MENMACAIVFSSVSRGIVDYSIYLARRLDARLLVFHSIPVPGNPMLGHNVYDQSRTSKQNMDRAREKIAGLMEGCDVKWEPVVAIGDPVTQLEEVLKKWRVDICVTARYKMSGLKRKLFGTVVERCIRTLPLPVLTLWPHPGPEKKPVEYALNNVVIGCDIPVDDISAYSTAIEFARCFSARLHVVHAIEQPTGEIFSHWEEFLETPYTEAEEEVKNIARFRLERHWSNAPGIDVPVEIDLRTGLAAEELLKYGEKIGADMLVIGVRPHSRLEQFLIGSTTEDVIRNATCPVLTVPLTGESQKRPGD